MGNFFNLFKKEFFWQNRKSRKNLGILIAFLIAFSPLAIWVFIINRYGVNIYYEDQWVYPARQIVAYFKGTLNQEILFEQYSENRQVFPRIFSIVLTILGHEWNTRWEMLLGLALSALISLLAFQLLQRTNIGKTLQNIFIIGLFNYLFFSIATWYFRLFSITFERLLVELVLIINLLVYTIPIRNALKVAIFIISGFIAQYSHSGGIAIWPLSLLLVLDIKCNKRYQKITIISIYLLFFALSTALYFWDYRYPIEHGSLERILAFNPLEIVRFILAFLGNPLADEYSLSVAVGLVVSLSFLIVAFSVFVIPTERNRASFNYLLPWLVLGLYPITLAIMVSITRLPMSQDNALRLDYKIIPMYLPLATLALMAIQCNNFVQSWRRQFFLVFVGVFLGMFIHYNLGANNFDQLLTSYNSLQRGKACAQLVNLYYSEECLKNLHFTILTPKLIVRKIRIFEELGLLRPGLVKSLDIDSDSSGKWGYIDRLEANSREIAMHGWAILENRPADAVIIIHRAENQPPKILTVLATGQPREDVSKLLNNRNFNSAGWKGNIKIEQIPTGANICSISAYGFDNESNRLFPLHTPRQVKEKC